MMKILNMTENSQGKHLAVLLLLTLTDPVCARAAERSLTPEGLQSLQEMIRPQPDESHWAKVPWEINLKRARDRAARDDKPLLLWRSGGGDVLGRT